MINLLINGTDIEVSGSHAAPLTLSLHAHLRDVPAILEQLSKVPDVTVTARGSGSTAAWLEVVTGEQPDDRFAIHVAGINAPDVPPAVGALTSAMDAAGWAATS